MDMLHGEWHFKDAYEYFTNLVAEYEDEDQVLWKPISQSYLMVRNAQVKKRIRINDYDDVLKRVAEIVSKTNHRVEIWDSKAYKYRNKDVCSDNGDGPTRGVAFF